MTNHIMLRLQALVRLIPVLVFSFLSAIGLAQMTKPVTKSEPQEKTAPAQTQQIGPAFDEPQRGERDDESGALAGTWYQLPDAPSATQKVEDAPVSYGYWDYTQPQMSLRKTATDPMFYGPFLGLLAANAIDIEATRASGCGEAHDFGRRPSRLSQYGQDYAADFAIGTMAFFMHRSHFRLIPQGMLGYGIAIHIRGAVRGFQANCH